MLLAFSALLANKMRALLTMLGIIIGIGSVITIVTVGNSMSSYLSDTMGALGANNLSVGLQRKSTSTESTAEGLQFRGPERRKEPTDKDMFTTEMLSDMYDKFSDRISAIALTTSMGDGTVENKNNSANVSLIGVNSGYFVENAITMVAGNQLSEKAFTGSKGVALVSDKMVENIFNGDNKGVIGKTIEINVGRTFYEYTISGVYEYKDNGYSMTSSSEIPTNIYVPIGSAQKKLHQLDQYSEFDIVGASGTDMEELSEDIEKYFQRYYHNNEDFRVSTFSMQSMMEETSAMLNKISIAISVIAGISLLVGGIGVMNIMLVSVSERTREIGTRKALGATNSSIRVQFIAEAMVICLVGGIIGVTLGVLGGSLGAGLLEVTASPSITSILGSLGFSVLIGVFFGYYPANKAAKMNPIDALGYE